MRAEHYHESNLAIRNKNEEFVIATWERLLVALHIGLWQIYSQVATNQ